jgi:prepilin-type N-terminal cleavage/methylation domain-containing protein
MPRTIAPSVSSRTHKGFSLIEVVVVVSVLGIACAFAVPRFTTLANQARASEVIALAASLRSAAQASHDRYVASGAAPSTIDFRGKLVTLKNGYPDASPQGISNTFNDWDGFATRGNGNTMTFSKIGALSDALCSVSYIAAPLPNRAATITAINISGC